MNWKSSDESLDRYLERLHKPSDVEPIIVPYKPLWSFGGFGRIWKPGLLVTVVGMSGGMKTAWLETVTDNLRRSNPYDILWWGTEWTWESMADRAVQRHGGANLDDVGLHELALYEKEHRGSKRYGRELPRESVSDSEKAVEYIKGWPGKSHMTEELVSDVEDLLLCQSDYIDKLRASGRDVRVSVWDYLQLLDLGGAHSDREKMSALMNTLQKFCFRKQVVGITASQVTKSASYAAKKDEEKLTAESGQNFRSDESKLVITLRPNYTRGLIGTTGEINVDKNNAGRTGTVNVNINPARFLWTEEVNEGRSGVSGEELMF